MRKSFSNLAGADLVMLHFAGNMSMWGFSQNDFSSQLHVQCSYRLTYCNKTILCQDDAYTVVNNEKYNTLIHVERDLLTLLVLPIRVVDAVLYDNQDIQILFSDDMALHIYADLKVTHEQWRYWEESACSHENAPDYVAIDGTIKSY